MKNVNVAVVGATGAVGRTIIDILQERNFPVKNIVPLASARSNGHEIDYNGRKLKVFGLILMEFGKKMLCLKEL